MTSSFTFGNDADAQPLPADADALHGDPDPVLTRLAHSLLVTRLMSYGNVLSKQHHDALLTILSEFTRIGCGSLRGRFGYPLPTGMGKSQAVIAWIAAAAHLGRLGDIRVAVVLSKVEALCHLARELTAAGINRHLIGLRHSYEFDAARVAHAGPDTGLASMPNDDDALDRPILLVTHNKVKQLRDADRGLGGKRNILIWDESLLVSEPASFSLAQLEQLANGLGQFLPAGGPARSFLERVGTEVREALRRAERGDPPTRLSFFDLRLSAAQEELRSIPNKTKSRGLRNAAQELLAFLDLGLEEFAVTMTAQGAGLISYRITVPHELDRVIVLDASYNARALTRLDPSMTLRFDGLEQLKRYDNVVTKHVNIASGRESVEADCSDTSEDGRRIPRLVAEIAASMPANGGVIVFTHKHRSAQDVDIVGTIRSVMQSQQIDPDATITVGGLRRPKYVFLTWGNETSLSEYSYCEHVVLAGLMYRPLLDLAAHATGQAGNLLLNAGAAELREVQATELLHLVFQAMSRGACRVVENGQARPMKLWLLMKGESLREPLCELMPGLTWSSHQSPILVTDEALSADVERVARYLRSMAASATRVSIRAVKNALPDLATASNERLFRKALELAAQVAGWLKEGRSLARAATT